MLHRNDYKGDKPWFIYLMVYSVKVKWDEREQN